MLKGPTIYFLQRGEDGLIKIGFTDRNARRRRSEVQVGCPEKIRVLAEVLGTLDEEQALHKQFESARVRGEWFEPVPELLELINAIVFDGVSIQSWLA